MIAVPRGPAPAHLAPAAVDTWTRDLCARRAGYYRDLAAHQAGTGTGKPARPSANGDHYGHDEVRDALRAMFGAKCAYCEGEVAATGPQHVEHFRPASRYPKLAYAWENLLLACAHCNSTHKRDRFPVGPSSDTPPENPAAPCANDGAGEDAWLLNPCTDHPAAHLTFSNGRVVALTARGDTTRDVCGLNRNDLIESRLFYLKLLLRSLEEYRIAGLQNDGARRARHADDLRLLTDATTPYSAMARAELAAEGIDWRTL